MSLQHPPGNSEPFQSSKRFFWYLEPTRTLPFCDWMRLLLYISLNPCPPVNPTLLFLFPHQLLLFLEPPSLDNIYFFLPQTDPLKPEKQVSLLVMLFAAFLVVPKLQHLFNKDSNPPVPIPRAPISPLKNIPFLYRVIKYGRVSAISSRLSHLDKRCPLLLYATIKCLPSNNFLSPALCQKVLFHGSLPKCFNLVQFPRFRRSSITPPLFYWCFASFLVFLGRILLFPFFVQSCSKALFLTTVGRNPNSTYDQIKSRSPVCHFESAACVFFPPLLPLDPL